MTLAYDLEGRGIFPLADLFDLGDFPLADLIPQDALQQIFDGLYYTEANAYREGDGLVFEIRLAFDGELALTPPGTEAVALVIGAAGGGWTALDTKIVIGPSPSLSLVDVPITLRISKDVLRDVATDGPAELTITATLELQADGGLTLEFGQTLSLQECEIAGTGITMSASELTWNFEHGKTIPEATAAGLQGEFIGIGFRQAIVTLPPDLGSGAPTLTFDYCCIGTGGFTGGVQATPTVAGAWSTTLGGANGFTVELERIALRFSQSQLVMGEIDAVLRNLSFFDSDVALDLQLSANKGLQIAVAAARSVQVSPATSSL